MRLISELGEPGERGELEPEHCDRQADELAEAGEPVEWGRSGEWGAFAASSPSSPRPNWSDWSCGRPINDLLSDSSEG